MADETVAAVPDAGPSESFADAYANMMGDLQHVPDEPDEPAGDSPAASPDALPQDAPAAAAAGDPPAEATPTTAPLVDDDPFAGSAPASYRVNGEERSFDGITVMKDRSGFIDSDKMDLVLHRLSERDHLFEQAQHRQKNLTDLEELTRWKPDPTKDEYVTGAAALQARDLAYATTRAERDAYDAILSSPEKLASLLLVDQETGRITWNQPQVEKVMAQIENAKLRVSHAIEKHYAQRPAQPVQPTQASQPARVDPVAAAEHLIQATGVKGFGDADKQWVASLAEELVRPATQADVAKNPTLVVGQPFAPPKLISMIEDRAALLARSAKQVEAASVADKENKARQAAANVGKKPATTQARAQTDKPKTRQQTREEAFAAEYERQQDAMAGLMRVS